VKFLYSSTLGTGCSTLGTAEMIHPQKLEFSGSSKTGTDFFLIR